MRRLTDPIGTRLLEFITNESVKEDAHERLNNPASAVRQAQEEFLGYFAERTKAYLLVAAALFVAIGVIDIGTCGAVPNQFYGLTLDLLGAIVLSRGLLKGPYGMAAEAAEYWSRSPPLQRALAEDAADGIWGVMLLVTGILLQFLAVAGVAVFTFQNCPF